MSPKNDFFLSESNFLQDFRASFNICKLSQEILSAEEKKPRKKEPSSVFPTLRVNRDLPAWETILLSFKRPPHNKIQFLFQLTWSLQVDPKCHTVRVGDFHTPVSLLDMSDRQKTNREIRQLTTFF